MTLFQNKNFNLFLLIIFGIVTLFYLFKIFDEPQNKTFNLFAVLIGAFGVWICWRDYKKSQKANPPSSDEVKSQKEEEELADDD
ncbi:MAG: hypothetical protein ABI550_01900 [Ignavibacteriaceae bacterium]